MLRAFALLLSLSFLTTAPRAEEIPFSNIIALVPHANGNLSVLYTGLGPCSSLTGPSTFFVPDTGRAVLFFGAGGGPLASQSGAAYAVSASIGAPRATHTPAGPSVMGPASTIETNWRSADGENKVVTPCFSHNTAAQCAQAHLEMVRAMQALFPPVRQ